MNIILLGLPGSGKGTQAKILVKEGKFFYFEAGRFSRKLAKTNSEIKKIVEQGKLIPEKKMTRLVFAYLKKHLPSGCEIIFEGFPRFIGQYKDLCLWLEKTKRTRPKAFLLKISEKTAVSRLSARRTCAKCGRIYNLVTNPPHGGKCRCGGKLMQRKDDQPKVIRRRFQEYEKRVKPLLAYLKKENNLVVLNGEEPIEVIAKNLKRELIKN